MVAAAFSGLRQIVTLEVKIIVHLRMARLELAVQWFDGRNP